MRQVVLMLLLLCGLNAFAQEDDYTLEVGDDGEELVEEISDSVTVLPEDVQVIWTPEQRWMHNLCHRLDSVLLRDAFVKKTVRRGKGKKARRVTTTVRRGYRVGISVYDLTTDTTVYLHNADELYIPASNQKIFVSVTALEMVGSDHNFFTDIYTDGGMEEDSTGHQYLKGNVYVRGGFDPTLDKTAVDFVAGKLMALDMDSIDGKVYGYEPQKSQVAGTWFWDKHPFRVFPSLLFQALKENGIAFSEENAYGSLTEPTAIEGVWVTSLNVALSETLGRMMKNSDNYYAESMLLNLCDLRDETGWSYDLCKQQVRDMTMRAGVRAEEYVIADGSGLSHANKSTPTALTRVLRYAYHDPRVFDKLYESMPIAGVDGTLARRMQGTVAYANVRAKTGTVNGVSTLSGYATAPNGHLLAFSILVNNVNSSSVGRHLQDMLCVELAR